jgi:arylamine N-acetyltransferase
MTDVLTDADLNAYLTRIGCQRPLEPTVQALSELVAAHNGSIPFENLDPLFGVPVDHLGADALADKLVHRRRGGYCYEHNGLMGFVLERLGYRVDRLVGRVVWMREPGSPLPATTHQVLAVTGDRLDGHYLVDVGFGGQTLTSPIRMAADLEQETRHEPYRLVVGDEGLVLHARVRGQWQALYEFTERPQPRIDLEVGSWYTSTHPSSPFVTGMTAAMVTDDGRFNLRGRNLAVHRGGTTEKVRFDTAAEVVAALQGTFGIDLADVAEPDVVQARVAQVLDS